MVGSEDDISGIVMNKHVGEVYVFTASANVQAIEDSVGACWRLGVKIQTLPGMYEIGNGRPTGATSCVPGYGVDRGVPGRPRGVHNRGGKRYEVYGCELCRCAWEPPKYYSAIP